MYLTLQLNNEIILYAVQRGLQIVFTFVYTVFISVLLFIGCVCIWRPQVDVECLSLLPSLTLELTYCARLDGQ